MRILSFALVASFLLISLAPAAVAVPEPKCGMPHEVGLVPFAACTVTNSRGAAENLLCFTWRLVWGPAEPCPAPL